MKNRADVYMLILITISIFSNLFDTEVLKPRSRVEIEAVLARTPKSLEVEKQDRKTCFCTHTANNIELLLKAS